MYVKIDVNFFDHPKVIEAAKLLGGRNALDRVAATYMRGLCNAFVTNSDGLCHEAVTFLLQRRYKVVADALAKVGLWDPDPDGGWRIHDYHDWNDSAAIRKAQRLKAAGRKRRSRANLSGESAPSVTGLSQSDPRARDRDRGTSTSTSLLKDPKRSDGDLPLLGRWREAWEGRHGAGLMRVSHREVEAFEAEGVRLGPDEVERRIGFFLADASAWLMEHQHPLGVFVKQIERYQAGRLSPAEASEAAAAARRAESKARWDARTEELLEAERLAKGEG